MFTRIHLSYHSEYEPNENMDWRDSSVDKENIEVTLGRDFSWPAHVRAFLNFLNQCGYIISYQNIDKIVEVCDNCIEPYEEKKCDDT